MLRHECTLDDKEKTGNTAKKWENMKRAFTLVEILIVVAILGILAAIVLPTFRGHIAEAREAAAKDTLRTMRNAIEIYAAKNDGVPPGYQDNDPTKAPGWLNVFIQLVRDGKYIQNLPRNPFNKLQIIKMIPNDASIPENPDGLSGWIYKPATKDFRIDWPGNDSKGVSYYDY